MRARYVRLGFLPDGEDPAPIAAALNAALPDVLNASVSELNFKVPTPTPTPTPDPTPIPTPNPDPTPNPNPDPNPDPDPTPDPDH